MKAKFYAVFIICNLSILCLSGQDSVISTIHNDSCLHDQTIYQQDEVETRAIPPGGFMSYRAKINETVQYPHSAAENGIAGRVTLEFTVCKEGFKHDLAVINSKSMDCDEEAMRLINSVGNWTAALKNGESISSKVRYSVNFRAK